MLYRLFPLCALLVLISLGAGCSKESDSEKLDRILDNPISVADCVRLCPELEPRGLFVVAGTIAESEFEPSEAVLVDAEPNETILYELSLGANFGPELVNVKRSCIGKNVEAFIGMVEETELSGEYSAAIVFILEKPTGQTIRSRGDYCVGETLRKGYRFTLDIEERR